MNNYAIAFLLINTIIIFLAPRRMAPIALLMGACYMTLGQKIELGPFTFTVIRILVVAGVIRIIIRGERLEGRLNSLDWLVIAFAVWALISSAFHNDFAAALIFRLGLVYNICGIYFLLRVFCRSLDDLVVILHITAFLLTLVAIEMLFEKITGRNLFHIFGGVGEFPAIRDGRIRAQGPFAHSILAGTVGSVSLPLMIGLWRTHSKSALIGILACLIMIITSSSSGPILSALAGLGALFMWNFRHKMKLVRWIALIGYIGLDVVMKAPAYYLMARISPIGASTGWYRARLIESALIHINEWWIGGTDFTRHWMPTGVSWSPNHTDITNYYIKMGVLGGLPLMILLILLFAKGFSLVGKSIQSKDNPLPEYKFIAWTLGASLFAHAATCLSVSYFDQSFIFLYLTLAIIGSMWSDIELGKNRALRQALEVIFKKFS